MAGRRGATAVLLLMSLVCVPPARPNPALHPLHAHKLLTTTSSPRSQTTSAGGEKQQEGGWSLKDTLVRLDDLLQRHNDYNDVMLESGEEDDQLSRLLYRLQHLDRVREGWYDIESTLPPLPKWRQDAATTKTRRGRREHRLEATTFNEVGTRVLTRQDRMAKKSKERKTGRGGRGRKKYRGKSWERRHGCVPRSDERRLSQRPGKHHSIEKHKHRNRGKNRYHSWERCMTEGGISTSTSTTTTVSTQIPTKPSPAPTTSIIHPAEVPEEGGGGLDASISYEELMFSPDAEILMPFL